MDPAITLRSAHTADLAAAELAQAEALLRRVFEGDFADSDWEHALGGVHVLAWEGDALVGHASVIQRRLLHGGRALRAGYVEAVAVAPSRQRRGIGGRLMDVLEGVIRRAYELGALGASDGGAVFYARRAWQPWRGPLAVLAPEGIVATPEEQGGVFVLPGAVALDLDGDLVCDYRGGDVW